MKNITRRNALWAVPGAVAMTAAPAYASSTCGEDQYVQVDIQRNDSGQGQVYKVKFTNTTDQTISTVMVDGAIVNKKPVGIGEEWHRVVKSESDNPEITFGAECQVWAYVHQENLEAL